MNANLYVIEDYENEPLSGPKKTNPIQTQSKPVLSAVEWANFFKGQNELKKRLPENLATPTKTKGPGKKWILFEQSYILTVNRLHRKICSLNNVQV